MALFLLLVVSLCTPFYKVDARSNSQQDRQQSFTRLPEFKNNLATIHDDFDCIDIYKQPSFEHPLLKNHKIQFNPTFARDTTIQSKPSYSGKAFKVNNFTKGCPQTKVPIYKKAMRHQMRTSSSSKIQIEENYPAGHHFATLDTTQSTTYRGASASISLYNLSLQANQYSFSQIWLQSGPPTELNSIQVGFGVHPSLYGDSQLRLTSYWTVDGYQTTGCFNILCPGFVQVSSTYSFGYISDHSSVIGSSGTWSYLTQVKQDPSTGNWWFFLGDPSVQVGYWPKEIFTHLGQGASLIRYGGETFAPPNMLSPPMGSGRLPQEKYGNSAYMSNLQIVDSEYNQDDIKPKDMKSYIDTSSNCYDLWYTGEDQGKLFKQAFLFGGPGGPCAI